MTLIILIVLILLGALALVLLDTLTVGLLGALTLLALGTFVLAPRPRLNPAAPPSRVPETGDLGRVAAWLADFERGDGQVIDGAEATIIWANGEPAVTEHVLLYIHGFSASRQETAPLTEELGKRLGANVMYARLAGHGLAEDAMEARAEDWLASVTDSFDIACRIGEKVIVIGTSTGAPLAIWATRHLDADKRICGMIFLAPNFRVRQPLSFLLTWPWAPLWVPPLLGTHRSWEPENEQAAKYWTHRYSTLALIEMQKVVDWARQFRSQTGRPIPLATLYMEGDPTIDTRAAIDFHHQWPAAEKELVEVTIDRENAQHVFVGDITAPHRIEWCVETCLTFMRRVSPHDTST